MLLRNATSTTDLVQAISRNSGFQSSNSASKPDMFFVNPSVEWKPDRFAVQPTDKQNRTLKPDGMSKWCVCVCVYVYVYTYIIMIIIIMIIK